MLKLVAGLACEHPPGQLARRRRVASVCRPGAERIFGRLTAWGGGFAKIIWAVAGSEAIALRILEHSWAERIGVWGSEDMAKAKWARRRRPGRERHREPLAADGAVEDRNMTDERRRSEGAVVCRQPRSWPECRVHAVCATASRKEKPRKRMALSSAKQDHEVVPR